MKKLNTERLDKNRDVKSSDDEYLQELSFDANHEYEEYVSEEEEEVVDDKNKSKGDILCEILDESLKELSCDRGYVDFRFENQLYRGVVMGKTKSGKYIFDIGDKKLKAFDAYDIVDTIE